MPHSEPYATKLEERSSLLLYCLLFTLLSACATASAADVVTIDPSRVLNTFTPIEALGAGVDGHVLGDAGRMYTKRNVDAMKSAGLGALTYRLRTELAIEAWHWNATGVWSDRSGREGYWTSSAQGRPLAAESYGYRLPRRGSTIDQANNDGYSRLDDGDEATFWKSDPYLDAAFTGDDNAAHPQWVAIDLGESMPISQVRIDWGEPYATRFRIEALTDADLSPGDELAQTVQNGKWTPLCSVALSRGQGPISECIFPKKTVRFLRIVMLESSGKVQGNGDPRDQVGYAIRELHAGAYDPRTGFVDIIRHAPNKAGQTVIMASSTDPWHEASDRDARTEQPALERILRSGLMRGRPMMLPVGVAYDTPENAAGLLRAARAQGFPVAQVELGEEPDGQIMSPEDYGALYIQFARALKAVDPSIQLGGPSLQTDVEGWHYWQNAKGEESWMKRFLAYLDAHGRLGDFSFFSFEWYPFDDFRDSAATQLLKQPKLLREALAASGVPRRLPWYMTEYGYSAFAGEPEVTIAGALMNTDIALSFLAMGGARAYLYGYEAVPLITEPEGDGQYGNLTLLLAGKGGAAPTPAATYYAIRMLTTHWLGDGTKSHRMIAAEARLGNGKPTRLIAPYAVVRPDGSIALILLNKDPVHVCKVRLNIAHGSVFAGPVELLQYSARQYQWHPGGLNGYAKPNVPPARSIPERWPETGIDLPPLSISCIAFSRGPKGQVARRPNSAAMTKPAYASVIMVE